MVRRSTKEKRVSLINELLKDSSRSDRELAKIIGISQPTVSRDKKDFEEIGLIRGYTVVPDFFKLGFELMAITFVKTKTALSSIKERKKATELAKDWMMKHPNVILASYCRGMDADAVMISFHKSYLKYDEFMEEHNRDLGPTIETVRSSLINLQGKQSIKPFHFKYLANSYQTN